MSQTGTWWTVNTRKTIAEPDGVYRHHLRAILNDPTPAVGQEAEVFRPFLLRNADATVAEAAWLADLDASYQYLKENLP